MMLLPAATPFEFTTEGESLPLFHLRWQYGAARMSLLCPTCRRTVARPGKLEPCDTAYSFLRSWPTAVDFAFTVEGNLHTPVDEVPLTDWARVVYELCGDPLSALVQASDLTLATEEVTRILFPYGRRRRDAIDQLVQDTQRKTYWSKSGARKAQDAGKEKLERELWAEAREALLSRSG